MTDQSTIGFAALRTLVSDVEPLLSEARRVEVEANAASQEVAPPPNAESARDESPPRDQTQRVPRRSFRIGNIGLAVVVVAIILLIAVQGEQSPPASSASDRPLTTDFYGSAPADSSHDEDLHGSLLAADQAVLQEHRPVPGDRDRVLGLYEIQYCLAERIRLDAAEGRVDRYDHDAITRFNAYVDAYNVTCGAYQYRDGDLERARTVVEQHRASIEAEGRARF